MVIDFSVNNILKKHVVYGNLISLYFYNNKPFYFMVNACDNIKWVEK